MTDKKILILEDDETFRPIWEYIFSKVSAPIKYHWAVATEEAEALFDQHQFDLVIADIFLEGEMTGLDMWNRHEQKIRNKTIIVSSLEQRKVDKYLGERDYYPFYIKKPLIVTECIETINWILKTAR